MLPLVRPAALCFGARHGEVQTAAAALGGFAPGKAVALTPDACASVSQGGTLTFGWNPVFDATPTVATVQEFTLSSAKAGAERNPRGRQNWLHLHAMLSRGDAEPAISPQSNGYYLMRFHVHLKTFKPGTYNLVEAEAAAPYATVDEHRSLGMTNNPHRLSASRHCRFCGTPTRLRPT